MLDDEATDLLRRHLLGVSDLHRVLVDRGNVEREIGAVRARALDWWVEANDGELLPSLQYDLPRWLVESDDRSPAPPR